MKLSKETLSVFKNFANINANLIIKPGNKLTTMSAGKNIVAEVTVAEQFPIDFGVYDLNEFLGALSLFESPDLNFSEKFVTIKEGKNSVKYFAANMKALTPIPTVKPLPEADISFTLSGSMINQIQKVSSILHASDFSIVGDGTTISVVVGDKTNPTGNTYDSVLGETDKTFKVDFKVENLKLMPGDYKVDIAAKKISRFQAVNSQTMYYIAIELTSTFGF